MTKEFKTAKEAIAYAKENHLVAVTVGGKKLAVSSREEKRLLDSGARFAFLNIVEKDGEQIVVTIPVDGNDDEEPRDGKMRMQIDLQIPNYRDGGTAINAEDAAVQILRAIANRIEKGEMAKQTTMDCYGLAEDFIGGVTIRRAAKA
jgi:hypothetical protein